MELTILGYILIPFGILLSIYKSDIIFYFFIFFTPFTAASLLNIKSITFGLQPSYWFGFLWILFSIPGVIRKYRYASKREKTFIKLAIAFWFVILISLIMPVLLKGKVLVHYPGSLWEFDILGFRTTNITQFLYISFVLIILVFTMFEVRDKEKLFICIKTLLGSLAFSILWGIFQFLSFYIKIKYPIFLFNNNIGFSQGWDQVFYGIQRVSSISTEPSMYAMFLLMTISILIALWINEIYIVNKRFLNIVLVGSLLVLVLTISTTAYVGFIFLLIFVFLYNIFSKLLLRKHLALQSTKHNKYIIRLFCLLAVIFIAVSILCIVVFGVSTESLIRAIKFISIDKNSNTSGIDRSQGFIKGMQIFLKSPIIGVGCGSNRTFDLGTTLLSNIGIIGFAIFCLLMYLPISEVMKVNISTTSNYIYGISFGLLLSIICGLFTLFIAIPDLIFLYFWVIVGLAMALPTISNQN